MWVLSAAHDESIGDDQDAEDASQYGLDNDENDTSDSLSGLRDTKLLYKDENTTNSQCSDDLNEDVDDVSGFSLEWSIPYEKSKHQHLNDELSNGLCHSMSICSCEDTSFGEHVDDKRNEYPPEVFLVGIVEEAVLEPMALVLV